MYLHKLDVEWGVNSVQQVLQNTSLVLILAPGTMGLQANLTSGEIIEQLIFARQFSEIRNVVFMV